MSLRLKLFFALSWLSLVLADASNNTTTGQTTDPYLVYKPEFARSLPVQTLVTGVVFTLVAVLFVHIVFTGQYHWPLAPVNYALQLSGVITLLVCLIATIRVICAAAIEESQHWPYMLSYIAVNVPPLDVFNVPRPKDPPNDAPYDNTWTTAERGTWLLMNATVSSLVQITHIQFLTLLYPSKLEGRLIFSLLGPLSITSAIMQLIPIQGNTPLVGIANDIRNVCNATLSFLFTVSLFIWGLFVNRPQAWRTDGGTAVFGASALCLAIVSTALTILYVPKNEEYVWLPGLIWAVILWQSFLGWWWWVGAGNGETADLEQLKKRSEKMARKKLRVEKKEKSRRRRQGVDAGSEQDVVSSRSSLSDGSSTHRQVESTGSTSSRSRPRRVGSSNSLSSADTTIPRFLPRIVRVWYGNVRQAHVTAVRRQNVERAERIREIERGRSADINRTNPERRFSGWGLGSFGWRVSRGDLEYEMENNPRRRWKGDGVHESGTDDEQGAGLPRQMPNVGRGKLDNDRLPQSIRHRAASDAGKRSIWWWGPLNRWRLQDSTAYH